MADKTIQEIVGAIAPYKTNPSAMVRTLLDVTNDITEGKVVIANAAKRDPQVPRGSRLWQANQRF
jgi:hypothetical protein